MSTFMASCMLSRARRGRLPKVARSNNCQVIILSTNMLLILHRFLIILLHATVIQELLEDISSLAMIIEQLGHDHRRD